MCFVSPHFIDDGQMVCMLVSLVPDYQVNSQPMNVAMVNCFLQRLNKENDFGGFQEVCAGHEMALM